MWTEGGCLESTRSRRKRSKKALFHEKKVTFRGRDRLYIYGKEQGSKNDE